MARQLLLELRDPLAKVLPQRPLFHRKHLPVLHRLLSVLELFPRVRFALYEIIPFLYPVLLRQVRAIP